MSNGAGGTVHVAGSRAAIEGASVCRSGSTTDWHCGLIQQRDASVTYPQGTVFELTRTNVCAEPGDSGGSFISVDQAQGVTSGGSGDCGTGGITYFQPIDEILAAYGLTLATSGGSNPPLPTRHVHRLPGGPAAPLSSGQSAYQPNSRHYQRPPPASIPAAWTSTTASTSTSTCKSGSAELAPSPPPTAPTPDEKITYTGPAGLYRYQVTASAGSGSYVLGFTVP